MQQNELQHYGVIGMKWGIRRGRTQEAYEKASKKLKKLDDKVNKAEAKSRKASARVDRIRYGIHIPGSRDKAEKKARMASGKAANAVEKARKWYTKMEKVFAETDISLTTEQQKLGQSYIDRLDQRAYMRSLRG